MDIAREICTDSFYIVNSGLPCIAVTAVSDDMTIIKTISPGEWKKYCEKSFW